MKERYIRSFLKELPLLLSKNIIDDEISDKMKNYYNNQLKSSGKSNVVAIISSIAAILIGSGIILVLAHNWDILSRSTKTAIAFLPLIIGQFFTGYSYLKNKSFSWKEPSGIFLSLSVGATIALISQIYNISGDLTGFLFVWLILIFPLIYLLDSIGVFFIYLAEVITWVVLSRTSHGSYFYFWALLAAIFPYFYMALKKGIEKHRTIVISWIFALSLLIGLAASLSHVLRGIWIVAYSLMVILYFLIGNIYYDKSVSLFYNPFKAFGSLGIIVLSYIFTFKYVWLKIGWNFMRTSSYYQNTYPVLDYILISLLFFGVIFLFIKIKVMKLNFLKEILPNFIFIIISLLMFIIASIENDAFVPQLFFNIYLFFMGGIIVYNGTIEKILYKINIGMGIVVLIIISRFFDMNISFTAKGIVFIALGISILLSNLYFSKKFSKGER